MRAKVNELEEQSRKIQHIYNETTKMISQPLEAITIYNKLIGLVSSARNHSSNAQQTAEAARNVLDSTVRNSKRGLNSLIAERSI